MKALFWLLVMFGGFAGLAAVRLREKIKSDALRTAMLILGAAALFGISAERLYRLTEGFSVWDNIVSIDALVPTGWFLAGCYVLFVLMPDVGLNRERQK
jgi:hypothetical protein